MRIPKHAQARRSVQIEARTLLEWSSKEDSVMQLLGIVVLLLCLLCTPVGLFVAFLVGVYLLASRPGSSLSSVDRTGILQGQAEEGQAQV